MLKMPRVKKVAFSTADSFPFLVANVHPTGAVRYHFDDRGLG